MITFITINYIIIAFLAIYGIGFAIANWLKYLVYMFDTSRRRVQSGLGVALDAAWLVGMCYVTFLYNYGIVKTFDLLFMGW